MSGGRVRGGQGAPALEPAGLTTRKQQLLAAVDGLLEEGFALAQAMAEHPELSLREYETSRLQRAFLESRGFSIRPGPGGLETAYVADRAGQAAAPRVALLAEMDALPEIGHACGHNLSGPASLVAAVALAAHHPAEELHVRVVGCPAEEIGVGKRRLVEAGVFEGVDAAMMAHASDMRRAHRLFLGNHKFEAVFRGRASHAAAYPELGRNALDGVVAFYVSVGLLRQQLPREVRVHVIVSDGGRAPNVIPERAAARVWVRALQREVLRETVERVQACARGAAEATETELDIEVDPSSSPPLRPCLPLAELYARQLAFLGLPESGHGPEEHIGSSDITHVSQVVPTIHPNFPIGRDLKLHTRAFADAARGPRAREGLAEAARALALTAQELALVPEERRHVRRAFEQAEG